MAHKKLTVAEIAAEIGATVFGDDTREISGVNVVERATAAELAFVGCNKNLSRVDSTKALVIIGPTSAEPHIKNYPDKTFLLVGEPETAMLQIAASLAAKSIRSWFGISSRAVVADSATIGPKTNVYPLAVIGENVTIGEHCDIGPGVVIGDGCVIGDNVSIDANVVIYHDVIIGDDVSIQAGSVIGAEGFGYRVVEGRSERLPHLGTVRIENDVEIGACTTIDRAKIGDTRIDSGTRIDNQVMIAHNCQIGKHNIVVSQVGIAGSVSTGEHVVMAGQAGIADHVHLEDGVVIGAKTGVHRNMQGGKAYLGIPARDAALHAREQMALKRLPEMRSTVKQLEKQVADLEERLAGLLQTQNEIPPESRDAA